MINKKFLDNNNIKKKHAESNIDPQTTIMPWPELTPENEQELSELNNEEFPEEITEKSHTEVENNISKRAQILLDLLEKAEYRLIEQETNLYVFTEFNKLLSSNDERKRYIQECKNVRADIKKIELRIKVIKSLLDKELNKP